jgi:hypothetical protein
MSIVSEQINSSTGKCNDYHDDQEATLAEMANDPEIQAEIAAINTEFAIAEMDGLEDL